MPGTKPKNLVEDALALEFVNDVAYKFKLILLILALLLDEEGNSAVMPTRGALLVLEGKKEDIGVIVSTKDMFVRVDEIVGKLIADFVELLFGVDLTAQHIVKTMQSAQQREVGLAFKIVLVHCRRIKYNSMSKYYIVVA